MLVNILFISYAFHPHVGGIEASALLFLREFQRLGHDVKVVTRSPIGQSKELKHVEILRRPGLRAQWRLGRWADVVYHHNPAFSYWLPSMTGRPTVFSIHTWVSRTDRSMSWKDHLKMAVLKRYPCIANSHATADHLAGPATVIENAYDDHVFHCTRPWEQRRGAMFVGRLVSDKGIDIAIDAIWKAKQRGFTIETKIIGSGPEEDQLKRQADKLGLSNEIIFLGRLDPVDIADHLNSCQYLLIPSRWAEPFGIVALEGIACGCIPIGTNQGGLVDAIGPCGPLFAKDDADALADWLIRFEESPDVGDAYREHHADHLESHSPQRIAQQYLDVFESAICKRPQRA